MAKKVTKRTETSKAAPRAKQSRAKAESSAEVPVAASASGTAPAKPEASTTASPTEEQIRARAYEIFRKGVNPSDPVADWVQAERELRGGATL